LLRDQSFKVNLDTVHAPFQSHKGSIQLQFRGVSLADGLESAVGQAILYEEVSVADSLYEFRALLEHTEIMIRFRDVTIVKE